MTEPIYNSIVMQKVSNIKAVQYIFETHNEARTKVVQLEMTVDTKSGDMSYTASISVNGNLEAWEVPSSILQKLEFDALCFPMMRASTIELLEQYMLLEFKSLGG